jgi:hypothetical protein
VDVAGWLNETNLLLQAVVQMYGLLAPLLHMKVASVPVVQVSCIPALYIPSFELANRFVLFHFHSFIEAINLNLSVLLLCAK